MSTLSATAPRPGYFPPLALRHLWLGAIAPREAMQEGLAARIGEFGRLLVTAIFVFTLGLVDPETRALGRSAIENASDDLSRTEGLLLLAFGAVVIGLAFYITYWLAAVTAHACCSRGWSRSSLARARSVVALSAWFSLLPTVIVKALALSLFPAAMIAADPPSLFSSIEAVMLIPFFAACLMVAFGAGFGRALLTAILINGGFYLLLVILYLVVPLR